MVDINVQIANNPPHEMRKNILNIISERVFREGIKNKNQSLSNEFNRISAKKMLGEELTEIEIKDLNLIIEIFQWEYSIVSTRDLSLVEKTPINEIVWPEKPVDLTEEWIATF